MATVVGYKQANEFLQRHPGAISHEAFYKFLAHFQDATRGYARRQLSYFRTSRKLQVRELFALVLGFSFK